MKPSPSQTPSFLLREWVPSAAVSALPGADALRTEDGIEIKSFGRHDRGPLWVGIATFSAPVLTAPCSRPGLPAMWRGPTQQRFGVGEQVLDNPFLRSVAGPSR